MRIILGSQSPRRLEILRQVVPDGMAVEVIIPDIDERAIRMPSAATLTLAIARAKNRAVRAGVDGDAVILTADTVAVCNTRVREKPTDPAQLQHWLETYRHHPVTAVTSLWVHRTATGWAGSVTDTAKVFFRPFTDARIREIVRDRAFYGSAGGFLIEHPLMEHEVMEISGDRETVQGLPGRLAKLLVRDALESR